LQSSRGSRSICTRDPVTPFNTGRRVSKPHGFHLGMDLQRVKLYKLNDEGTWDDNGTGHVSVQYLEVGEVEEDLLDSKVEPFFLFQLCLRLVLAAHC
jgi:hypothetical protein